MKLVSTILAIAAAHAPQHFARATVYSGPCDGQTRLMADGTHLDGRDEPWRKGHRVDDHIVASTFLALGTRIRFDRRVFGKRIWTVRDSGGQFDLFRPLCRFGRWSNPTLGYRVISGGR